MRILNRPMFRYGGPIKEGVMHGMRDGGRTIAGGHQIGTPMGNRTGFADPSSPGFWARFAANYAPRNLTPKKLLSRLMPWKKAKEAKKELRLYDNKSICNSKWFGDYNV